jgi:peptide/nickel transport system ATP-binding protein
MSSVADAAEQSLLDVRDLTVSFPSRAGVVEAVRGLSFSVARGRTLAVVGESGSGKSVAVQTVVGLTRAARISGTARFGDVDLLAAGGETLRAIRGARIGMIFQNPRSSLHPFYRTGWQVVEAIRAHERVSRRAARERAIELFSQVGIAEPHQRVDAYPHEMSGGMLQRVMIAMAVALRPALLIADEPTTALDVTVQAQILALLRELQAELGMAIVLITHDLGVVAQMADDVLVMYGGMAMERAPRERVFRAPASPYTRALLAALPRPDQPRGALSPIAGQPPSMLAPPAGCPFRPRCGEAVAQCAERPPITQVGADARHAAACWRSLRVA